MIPYPPIRLPDGGFVSEPLLSALSPFLLAAALSPFLLRSRGPRALLLLSSTLLLLLSLRLYLVPSGLVPYGSNSSLVYPTLPLKPYWQPLLLSSLLLSLPLLGLRRAVVAFFSLPLVFHTSLLSAPSARAATTTIYVSEDCAVSRLYPSTSFNYIPNGSYTPSNYALRVETYSWLLQESDWRSYFQFDLSSLTDPSGYTRVINSAKIYLYVMYADLSIQSQEHWVFHDTSDWTMPYTWNSQPLGSASNPNSGIICDYWFYGIDNQQYLYNTWVNIDITSAVRANKGSTLTVGVRDADEDAWAYGIWTEFAAREKGSSYQAYLYVDYTDWPDYNKVPDSECSGGAWATCDDSGNVSGTWPNPSWIPGSATGWGSGTATAMWNESGNIIDQATKVVYHAEYEKNNPVTGPNPPNVGYGYYSYPSDGIIHWFWDEYSYLGSQVEGYSYTWAPCKNITNYQKIYSANLYVRWYAWTDNFDGPYARSYLKVGLQKPGGTYTEWTVADYTEGTRNTGWQIFSQDVKSYFQSAAANGSYNIRLYNFCHADCSPFDTDYFAWWVDYVHLYVYEDPIPPSITLSVSPNKQWYPNNTTITFSWSATDSGGSGLNSSPYAYAMDSSTPTNWGTTTSASYSTDSLSEGTHTFYVRARDGGQSMLDPNIATASFTFGVDKTAPILSKTGGPDGGSWISSTSANFSWSASDSGSGIQGYKYRTSTDGGSTWSSWTDTSSTSYTWSGLSSSTNYYKLQVQAIDQAGNSTTVEWSFRVDVTAPSVSKSSGPDGGSWINSSSAAFSWSGSDSHSGINNYEYRTSTDGGSTWSSWTSTTSTSYTWSNLSSSTNYYKIQVRAKDVAGNYSSAVEWSFRVDVTAPPTPSKSSGPDGGNWYNSSSQTFGWSSVTDSHSGLSRYEYRTSIDGGSTWSTWTSNGTSTSYTWSNLSSSTNYYKIQVRAVDAASNVSGSTIEWSFRIDVTAPSVSKSSGPDGGSWINSSSAAFSWSGSDSHSGINNYEYRTSTDGGSTWSSWTSTTSTSYTWSNLSSSTNYYKIQVRAKDVAGNYSSAVEWSFRVDGTAPSNPTSCSDSAGSSNNTWQNSITDPNFSWSGASDSHSGIAGYYYYWGTDPNGTSTNYTTSAAYDPPAVSSDGVYYLRVQTGDAAGNTSSWITIYTFKLDRGAPSGSATAPSHTWSTESNITLSCSDNLSGVSAAKYNWDSPADATTGTSYSNGQSITAPEGVHTLYLWVRDVAGNTSTWSGTYYIDTTAPPAPIVSSSTHPNPENWYSNPSVSFTWSSEENLSGIQGYYYYWGTDASGTPDIWTTSTSGTLTASSDGTWYFRIKAKNGSGLESPVASFQVNIDATPPPAPSVGSPTHPNENTWYQDNNPVFSWACDDLSGIAGYSYALDAPPDDTIDTTDTTVSFSNVSDGVHIFYVKAKNKVGLWGATASYTIRVWVIPESAPSPPKPSTLRIWPPGFSIKKGENLVLTVILLDPEGRPLGGKTIDWSANLGTLVPPSLATDELGRASVLYFAPEVEADTPVVVTVSFAGDESYTSSAAFFFGWVTSPRTTEILENLERAAERIGLLIEKVEEKLAVFEAVVEGRIGASLTVTIEVGVPGLWKEYEAENFRTQLRRAKTGELVEVVVENVRPARGTTILLNIENGVIPVGQIREVLVDNVPAGLADDYEDILDPTDDGGRCEYLILKGGRGAQILVSIPGFSSRTITIRGPLAAGKPWVPLVIAINIVVIVVVLLLVFQRRPRSY